MTNKDADMIQWKKYIVKCNNCGCEFLPWKCLGKIAKETNWRDYCMCPDCKNWIDRENSYVNKT